MAQAIIFGLLKQGYPANQITVSDPNAAKRQCLAEKGVNTVEASQTDTQDAVEKSEVYCSPSNRK